MSRISEGSRDRPDPGASHASGMPPCLCAKRGSRRTPSGISRQAERCAIPQAIPGRRRSVVTKRATRRGGKAIPVATLPPASSRRRLPLSRPSSQHLKVTPKRQSPKVAGIGPIPERAKRAERTTTDSRTHLVPPRQPKIRPILRPPHQPRPHRILQNVQRLFSIALLPAQPMIKEVLLPSNLMFFRQPALPVPNRLGHPQFIRKVQDQMHMIRHHDRDVAVPDFLFIAPSNRVEHRRPHLGMAKRVHPSILRANRNKERRLATHPNRRLVIQPRTHRERVSLPTPTSS